MKKIVIFTLITVLIFLTSCSLSFTTAKLNNINTASKVDADTNKPIAVTSTFYETSPMIYVTGTLNSAPIGTKIKAQWIYIENNPPVDIDSITYEVKHIDTDFMFSLSKPDKNWPLGEYQVKLYIDGKYEQSINFIVE